MKLLRDDPSWKKFEGTDKESTATKDVWALRFETEPKWVAFALKESRRLDKLEARLNRKLNKEEAKAAKAMEPTLLEKAKERSDEIIEGIKHSLTSSWQWLCLFIACITLFLTTGLLIGIGFLMLPFLICKEARA